MFEVVALLTAK